MMSVRSISLRTVPVGVQRRVFAEEPKLALFPLGAELLIFWDIESRVAPPGDEWVSRRDIERAMRTSVVADRTRVSYSDIRFQKNDSFTLGPSSYLRGIRAGIDSFDSGGRVLSPARRWRIQPCDPGGLHCFTLIGHSNTAHTALPLYESPHRPGLLCHFFP